MVVACRLTGLVYFFFFQAEDGIRDLVRSRGLGDVYKRQLPTNAEASAEDRQEVVLWLQDLARRVREKSVELLSLIHI